ncbi:MAG: isoprenylcysteine carboxylmethyltransferase family protein [Candidatus Heimdallarchaeota archaeon]|nr:isoprenylcysteine carboxylmethyltransferase family protein [Candidatus Heimdallarchaeota archaeon]
MSSLSTKNQIAILLRLAFLPPITVLFLHVPAGDYKWLDAWLFIIALEIISVSATIWLMKSNPELIEERLKGNFQKGQNKRDTGIILILSLFMLAIFPVAGWDYRNNFLMLGLPFKIIGWVLLFLSLLVLKNVMQTNTYLSRSIIIQEERKHKVIDSGPYSVVRHPMYSAVVIMTVAISLLLGSALSLIPGIISLIFLYIRAISEEKLLEEQLDGYKSYKDKVRKRIVPYLL